MKTSIVTCGLCLLLPSAQARVISDTCVNVAVLPLITVNKGPGGYENEYVRTYSAFLHGDLTAKAYTITQTCPSINCKPAPLETAPPPGFTHAIVYYDSCKGSHSQVAALTFPAESVGAYISSGYVVSMLDPPSTAGYRHSTQEKAADVDGTCKGNCTHANLPTAGVSSWLGPFDDRTSRPLFTGSLVESASETPSASGDSSATPQGQNGTSESHEKTPQSDNGEKADVDDPSSNSESDLASPTTSKDEQTNGNPVDHKADNASTIENSNGTPEDYQADSASTGEVPPTSTDTPTSSDQDSKSPQNDHASPADGTEGGRAEQSNGPNPPEAVVTVNSAAFSMANVLRCILMGAGGVMILQFL